MVNDHDGISSFGYEENTVAAASYLFLGPIVYFLEHKSNYVRFHALQSTLGWALIVLMMLIIKIVPSLHILWLFLSLGAMVYTVFMMTKAYYGEEYQLPVIGKYAHSAIFDTTEDILAEAESEDAPKDEQKQA